MLAVEGHDQIEADLWEQADIAQGNDTRTHLFSFGKTHYFGSPKLKRAIAAFFRSELDAAVRYGATSFC
ncbi:hypothetical protein [Leptolyngbya sp. BL0902]|uniref:hypothetical protein n=1 Tax=Leptolyngbya sp. BL0902 TaxID=1115757 RepID=UPI0018E76FE7|nr:hypothetical protein [Leptolyngbya sp. BL0902]